MDCFPPFLFVGETWEDMVNFTGFLFGLHCHWDVIIAPQSLIFPSLVQVAQSRECSFWLLLSIYVVVLNAWWHVTLLSRANLSHAVPKTWHAPFFWYGASQASGNALSLKEGPELFIDRYHQKLGLPWWVSIKSLPANAGDPGQEDPLEKGMATHSSILAWRIPWKEEPGGPSSQGCKKSDLTERPGTHAPRAKDEIPRNVLGEPRAQGKGSGKKMWHPWLSTNPCGFCPNHLSMLPRVKAPWHLITKVSLEGKCEMAGLNEIKNVFHQLFT